MQENDFLKLVEIVRNRVEWDAASGVDFYPKPVKTAGSGTRVEGALEPQEAGPDSGGLSAGERLELLRGEIGDCTRCKLSQKRLSMVFGEGNPSARFVFVGEGPGEDEDQQGRPFVGRAGQLLNKIIAAIKLKREEVYICNVVKCRPPNNRTPQVDEIETCSPFLTRQIEIIKPEFVVLLGLTAAQTILNTKEPLIKLRGRINRINGIKYIVTYHPSALLRNERLKAPTWEDMKMLMKEAGIQL
ncbi:MAG: uracil-DNA glycosylase [Deltaproteobacteria bacterium]|nr:uracil-DNA glycosylase [Deltaproteobacteria bacterium]